MSEKIIWRTGVAAYGIKKRCRKPDWHCEETGRFESPDELKAKELAAKWIAENMKAINKAEATIRLVKVTVDQWGTSEKWEPFTKEHNLKIPLQINA